jgi:hypothetical protein
MFDAYELVGGMGQAGVNLSVALWGDLRAEGLSIPVVGSSDVHSVSVTENFPGHFTLCFAETNENDAIIAAVSADEEKLATFTNLKADYQVSVVNRLVNYGISDRAAIEGERDAFQALIDALDINAYKEMITAQYDENRKITDGTVVYVEYDNGTFFILNYNSFTVEVDLDKDGTAEFVIAPKNFVQGAVTAA